MQKNRNWDRLLLALMLCCGFASVGTDALQAKNTTKKPKPPVDDSKLNCKQLSGRVQVLIIQARTYDPSKKSSGLSRGMQSAFVTTFGNNPHGGDPDAQQTGDLQKMREYNQRLFTLGCKSYDIDTELKVQDPNETPAATIPAPKKPKVRAAQPPVVPPG